MYNTLVRDRDTKMFLMVSIMSFLMMQAPNSDGQNFNFPSIIYAI